MRRLGGVAGRSGVVGSSTFSSIAIIVVLLYPKMGGRWEQVNRSSERIESWLGADAPG